MERKPATETARERARREAKRQARSRATPYTVELERQAHLAGYTSWRSWGEAVRLYNSPERPSHWCIARSRHPLHREAKSNSRAITVDPSWFDTCCAIEGYPDGTARLVTKGYEAMLRLCRDGWPL